MHQQHLGPDRREVDGDACVDPAALQALDHAVSEVIVLHALAHVEVDAFVGGLEVAEDVFLFLLGLRLLLLVLLQELLLFELMEAPPDDLGASVLVAFRLACSSLAATLDVAQQSDTGVGTDVDFAGKGGDLVVDPVLIEGSKLFVCMWEDLRVPHLT